MFTPRPDRCTEWPSRALRPRSSEPSVEMECRYTLYFWSSIAERLSHLHFLKFAADLPRSIQPPTRTGTTIWFYRCIQSQPERSLTTVLDITFGLRGGSLWCMITSTTRLFTSPSPQAETSCVIVHDSQTHTISTISDS